MKQRQLVEFSSAINSSAMRLIIVFLLLAVAAVCYGQNVGIGTNTPQARLHLKGNGFPESFMYLQANTGQDAGFRIYEGETVKWHIFNQTSLGGFHIYNNAIQTALFLNQSNAYVGIGTTNPQTRLDVNGQLKMAGGSPGTGKVLTSDATGIASWMEATIHADAANFTGDGTTVSPLKLSSMGATAGQALKWNGTVWDNATDDSGPWTDDTYGVSYYGAKNVGVGINKPTQKLTIAEGDNAGYLNIQNSSSGYTAIDGMLLGMNALDGWLTTYENGKLLLGTNGSAKMIIAANGDVGIGTSTPLYQLDVAGPVNLNKALTGPALRCNGTEAIWYDGTYFSWGYGGTYNYFGDEVTIGTSAAPGYTLVVNGTAAKTGGGSWTVLSDTRSKNLLGNYDRGLNEIIQLQPVRFTYRPDNLRHLDAEEEQIGFVAQDVQKVFPEAVRQASDGYLDFNIHAINVALVNAVKDLKAENERLKLMYEQQEARFKKLEQRLNTRLPQ
jgi:hypothetical protein